MNGQSKPNDPRAEIYWLTERSLRGEILPEEIVRLDQLLEDDDCLGHYLQYISQTAALGVWAMSIRETERSESAQTERKSVSVDPADFMTRSTEAPGLRPWGSIVRNWFSGHYWMPASIVIGSIVGLLVFVGLQINRDLSGNGTGFVQHQQSAGDSVITVPVACLTANMGCSWGGESSKFQFVGSGVHSGEEIDLIEGIAEFRLANGVYVSMEGPAAVELSSPDALVLLYGKITTHVPWPVAEFRTFAGDCELAATDAEFGVSVTGSRVDIHVFSGEVLATNANGDADAQSAVNQNQSATQPGNKLNAAVVSSGRGLVVESTQNSPLLIRQWETANPSLFAARLTMAGRLPISRAYSDAVLASEPAGYWRFEAEESGIVRNGVPSGTDLRIVGDLRFSGLSGNRVAEFRPGSDCYLVSSERMDAIAGTEYSIEVWVKPSHVHCGTVLALNGTDTVADSMIERNSFLLELQSTARQAVRGSFSDVHPQAIRFLHRDPPSRYWKMGMSCFTEQLYRVRRWQHVVAVKRREQMELYVDGKLEGTTPHDTLLSPNLLMIVGRQESTSRTLQFIGQLDELAVYPRALEPDEIAAHYEVIEWNEPQTGPVGGFDATSQLNQISSTSNKYPNNSFLSPAVGTQWRIEPIDQAHSVPVSVPPEGFWHFSNQISSMASDQLGCFCLGERVVDDG